jgi:glutaryl-CoA dehydrogenase
MFESLDYYRLDDSLSEDEKMVRATSRQFTEDKVLPIIRDYHRQAEFPKKLIQEMGNLGFFGVTLPEKYGCTGMNYTVYGLIMQELERGDSAIRSFASVQSSLVMFPIYEFGSEEQKQKWLPQLASGKKIGCFGLTEPDFGSNPSGMLTTAEKTNNGYRLNGSKMWITNGTIADVAVVWAKLENKVRGFIVEKGTKGFNTNIIEGKFSLRASDTAELIFEDCEIPEDNLLSLSGGLKSPLKCLTQARFGIAWGAIGAAMACYNEVLNYSKTRIQFDKPIASFQIVQQKLVNMATEITKAQLLALQMAKLKNENKINHTHVSMAKRNNVDMALNIARVARGMLGANGISDEYNTIRHMLNLESVSTYEGTHDIHTLVIGEDITGISAFS